jgi:hypothetical protein
MEDESIEDEITKKGSSSKKVKELSMKDIYGDEDGEDYGDEEEDQLPSKIEED